jgi:shikimate kinase
MPFAFPQNNFWEDIMNLVLIGMPGAGKSTIGVILAKITGKSFIDTDLVIQQTENRLLQQIIDEDGVASFLAVEARTILNLQVDQAVIATGGSAVYSPAAMKWLRQNGIIIYLRLPCGEIEKRIVNMASRGIAIGKGQPLLELYHERTPLYEKYADIRVDVADCSVETAAERTVAAIAKYSGGSGVRQLKIDN